MPSQNLIDIIVKINDQATATARKIDDQLKKFGDTAQKNNQKIGQSSQMSQQQMAKLSHRIKDVITSSNHVGAKGKQQFERYNSEIQNSIVAFNRLDSETQEMLRYLSQMSDEGREAFIGMSSKAQECVQKFNQMEQATTGWDNVLDITKTKMSLVGQDTTSLKGKVTMVGSAIQTHLHNKWDGIKSKITQVGQSIKSGLGNALSTVKSKIEGLGNAFGGLGGVISSVFGGIGLAELGNMTIGASITRDRIKSLSQALLGAGKSTAEFDTLWKKMDQDTNTSLVSLDQLSQSLSVVKQMTGATGDQLDKFEEIEVDIGQRAILMGKQGEDAMAVMQSAGKGLNGEFEMLKENFGITKDKLEKLGWSGSADDVDGYTTALQKALDQSGDVSDMMDTSYGKLTSLKKMWSVAGRSLGDEFKPYVDQALTSVLAFLDANNDGALDEGGKKWLQFGYGIMAVSSGFMTIAPSIAPALSVFDNLAGKTKSVLQFVGLLEAEEGALTLATLYNSAVTKISAVAHGIYATAVGLLTGEIGLVTVATQIWNAVLSMNPLMLVVIAVIALTVAIYEVGKAFGWWSNVQEMLGAIWDGINRLWSAFINHPDVQAFISGVISGLSWLGQAIAGAITQILAFFDVQTGDGNWDIISTLIYGVGGAWEWLKGVIGAIVGICQSIIGAFSTVSSALGPFATALLFISGPVGMVVAILRSVVCILLGCSPGIVPALQRTQAVFVAVWSAISGYVSGVVQAIVGLLSRLISNVLKFATKMINQAKKTGTGFFNGIVNGIRNLPSKVYTIITSAVRSFVSVAKTWIQTAKEKAKSIVSSVTTPLSNLASDISSALSGVVDALTQPFKDAWATIEPYVSKIQDAVNILPFGGEEADGRPSLVAYGGEEAEGRASLLINANKVNATSVEGTTDTIKVEEELSVVLDFRNVPSGVDQDTLINALTEKKVINALVSNNTFQDADAKIKEKILFRTKRARGV